MISSDWVIYISKSLYSPDIKTGIFVIKVLLYAYY